MRNINSQITDLRNQIEFLKQHQPNATHIATKVIQELAATGHDFTELFDQQLLHRTLRMAERYRFMGTPACIRSAYRQERYTQEAAGFFWDSI